MQPIHRRFLVLAMLAIALGSCGLGRDIRGSDHGALLPALRMVVNLRDDEPGGRSHSVTEFEIDAAGADGDFANAGIKAGEYRLAEGGVAMRFGRRIRDRVQFVGITGMGLNRFDLSDSMVDDEETELGLRLGAEARVEIKSWMSGHARVLTFLRPFDLLSTQAEVALVFGNPNELGLLVVYKVWRFVDESSSFAGVDEVDLKVDGLFIGMEVRF